VAESAVRRLRERLKFTKSNLVDTDAGNMVDDFI